jgi:PAS domain S-box-containing protein
MGVKMKKPVGRTEAIRGDSRTRADLSSTERTRAEDALRHSEKKYRELFQNAEAGIFRSRIDGSAILAANRKLCAIFGYTEEEFIGNPAHIRWADADARDRMLGKLRENGSLHDYEVDIRTKDGTVRTVSVSLQLYPEQGYLEGSAIDITEHKHLEESARESEARFRQLAESVPHLIWTCRGDGPCDYLSPQWLEYTGIPAADQLGFGWLNQLHPDDRDRTVAAWNAAVETN